ncbi:anhydro-N-acetylmuramic acid kinase [Chromobacterium sp. ATCC 53434]|uniref:anhydro-N-acetylmuramic acid kinase n=1 Tax=Chromobacterium sp. (strain ATCC 53434 / SC 14030) TaxID=2059672 RepID=UPI000C7891E2|nr:anhydro-N-acetylmuramic acid kinase [Chromobacterium sp. ATCC 53434]AUH53609.1 anhydro-N-acetylmuramic acid kinase [Chromobacterium sp. ATCC 53434]
MSDLYIGMMSGTSLDGVDAALVRFDAAGRPELLADHALPYPDEVRAEILALQPRGDDELDRGARLGNRLAEIYARAGRELLEKAGRRPGDIRAVACHGQTVRHAPHAGYTIQIGNMARLAELAGIDVIADFRSRDVAAGGHGAPLVPAFQQSAFSSPDERRVILNIGGISNLARLHRGLPAIGFDCGPGNMLMDAWSRRHTGRPYDDDGRWAASGAVHAPLLAAMLAEPYLHQPPPKSTGRDLFDDAWLERHVAALPAAPAPRDVQATLLAFSARAIADAIVRHCPDNQAVYVCGGGARNGALMAEIARLLSGQRVAAIEALGLPAQLIEAVAFAWLGWRFDRREPGNLPEVTGAQGPRILGALYPR